MEDNKLTQEMKRHAVIIIIHANHSDLEISRFLKVARSFVNKVRRELEASDGNVASVAKCKKHEARSDKFRTSQFVQKVQGIIDEDPSKSIRGISKHLQVSECTIRRIIHEDLQYNSYAMHRGQFMSAQTREQRFIGAQQLLNKLKHPEISDMLWSFSDEKNFDQDQKINRRNDRWLCADPSDVPRVMHTKFPATVIVLGAVSNKGYVMPPHFFP
ncbi:PREDICTED: uncharacterized protein LOC106749367 [Dinoponera quadriceps]|uniref:Uncharacterized protein LOC106749367 n=1 Tax=Dinoponera quadriceps TaxID=609295 RepID=A0A6P3Y1Z7_DINQU|nr:PREDICTED: uncharacterized protein LOC106749367 [Dinoponera quadriceps]